MSKQDLNNNSNTNLESKKGMSTGGVITLAVLGVVGLGAAISSAYHAGVKVANRVLRRNDKEIRIAERRARKEAKRQEQEEYL